MGRSLTHQERRLIELVSEHSPQAVQDQLLRDADCAVAESSDDNTLISIELPGYCRPVYFGQDTYGVHGRLKDLDGADMMVLVFGDNDGRLLEIEFIKWSGGEHISPDWETLKINWDPDPAL